MSNSENGRDTGKPRNSGKPQNQTRDQRRIAKFNKNKAAAASTDWNEWMAQDERDEAKEHSRRGYDMRKVAPKPAPGAAKPLPNKPNSADQRAKVETPPRDDDIWGFGDFSGATPARDLYRQNLDHSSLDLVSRAAFADMERADPTIKRKLTYAAFNHVVHTYAAASMIHHAKTENADARFQQYDSPLELFPKEGFCLPKIVMDYVENFTNVTTVAGEYVAVNYPAAAEYLSDQAGHCGSFGDVDANSHNAYESYPCPFVTWRLIERTVFANQQANQAQLYQPWNPFVQDDAGAPNPGYPAVPANSVFNRNLMGYEPPERLHIEALATLQMADCKTSDDLAGKIRYAPELTVRVMNTISRTDIMKSYNYIPKYKTSSSLIGFVSVTGIVAPDSYLIPESVKVNSPTTFGAHFSAQCATFGTKRLRSNVASGVCATVAGAIPAGWGATINQNFGMHGTYAPVMGVDRPSLRDSNYFYVTGFKDRTLLLSDLINRHFRIQR